MTVFLLILGSLIVCNIAVLKISIFFIESREESRSDLYANSQNAILADSKPKSIAEAA